MTCWEKCGGDGNGGRRGREVVLGQGQGGIFDILEKWKDIALKFDWCVAFTAEKSRESGDVCSALDNIWSKVKIRGIFRMWV